MSTENWAREEKKKTLEMEADLKQKKMLGAKGFVRYEDVGWELCKNMLWITKLQIMSSCLHPYVIR